MAKVSVADPDVFKPVTLVLETRKEFFAVLNALYLRNENYGDSICKEIEKLLRTPGIYPDA